MLEQHSPSAAESPADAFGPFEGGEKVLWRGRAGIAEYAFDQAASLPRWTLPETTEVLVTDRRVVYTYAVGDPEPQIISGELRWLWPQHLRVQPGAQSTGHGAAAQVQLICGSSDGGFPALVFAGGDLSTVGQADRFGNVLRQAIARFRMDHAERLGLSTPQARMLSRLLIGPEFGNHLGGDGQTVTLQGALLVSRPAPLAVAPGYVRAERVEPDPEVAPRQPARPRIAGENTRLINFRPGMEQDATRAWQAARAEEATLQDQPDLASRAAELAARVADMVCRSATPGSQEETQPLTYFDVPTTDLSERAAALRRSAARFAGNSARGRVNAQRADRETGVSTRGNRIG